MSKNMKVGEFIEALQKFHKNYDVLIQPPGSEDTYAIKGIYQICESNWEMPQYDYANVVIEAMPYDLDMDQLSGEDSLEMYGDLTWYNTIDIFKQNLGDGNEVVYQLTNDGKVKILSCHDSKLNNISLDDALDEEMEKQEEYYKYSCKNRRWLNVSDFIGLVKNLKSSTMEDVENNLTDEEYDQLLKLCYKVQDRLFFNEE